MSGARAYLQGDLVGLAAVVQSDKGRSFQSYAEHRLEGSVEDRVGGVVSKVSNQYGDGPGPDRDMNRKSLPQKETSHRDEQHDHESDPFPMGGSYSQARGGCGSRDDPGS